MHRALIKAVVALALLAATSLAGAQAGGRTLRIIVPTPAGGPSDTAARLVAQKLASATGQPVIVENRPGAGGALAAQAVMAAAPDGQTLLWGIASMAGIPMLQKSPPYQSMLEMTPVSLVGRFTFAMFVHPDVAANSVAELVAQARRQPGKLAYATGTLGEYMAAAQFVKVTGVDVLRVPYKGGAQLMPDLVAGRVQFNIGPLSSGLPQVRDGKLRMVVVLQPERSAAAPDTPTLQEAGVAGVNVPTWQALFAPPKTPPAIADRIAGDVAAVLRDPTLRAQLEQQGLMPEAAGPQALSALVAQDTAAWRTFIRDYDIPQE
jgi:tripartite-type tricarboxylate transporter receptor subunit TctC